MLVTVFEDQVTFGRHKFRFGLNAGQGLVCDDILVEVIAAQPSGQDGVVERPVGGDQDGGLIHVVLQD